MVKAHANDGNLTLKAEIIIKLKGTKASFSESAEIYQERQAEAFVCGNLISQFNGKPTVACTGKSTLRV